MLHAEVWLPRAIEDVFAFFSNAFNLNQLTPPWLAFRILTPPPITMRVGALIDYRIRLKVLPMRWTSEITAYNPPFRFVDEQRRGPYTLWHHEHAFQAVRDGTLVTDTVHYAVPFNSTRLADAVDRFLVGPDLERIFAYRTERMLALLGTRSAQPAATPEHPAPAPPPVRSPPRS